MSSSDPSGESAVPISREEALEAEVSDLNEQLEQNTASLTRLTEGLEATTAQKLSQEAGSPGRPWSQDELAAWTKQLKRRGAGTDWKAFSEELRQEKD